MKPSLAIAIGAISGFVGVMALVSGVFDGLLPVNRLLGAGVCSLVALWVLLSLARARRERP